MTAVAANLPKALAASREGDIAILRLARPDKRNALNDTLVLGLKTFMDSLPADVKVIVLHAEGDHFSAGLDLSELTETSVVEGIEHSRMWHRILDQVEFSRVPVVSVLHGAVVGGGLEIACATHIRIAERSAYYALPEGTRGIFVGGSGSVRIPRLIGVARMMDMMLTGRTYSAEEGHAHGISQYLVDNGKGFDLGLQIARRIAENAPMTNFAVIQALPRIAQSDPATGLLMESLVSAIAQGDDEAKKRLKAFLEKRAPKAARN
ncbi:MAG TPA: crotonase/enoyl-CoA hydratase family protein [Xanthobacteraceae bacterium]|nr:crotonase/enoyl-CoA hydratase family protein [Xanthobacteraceae bacterium]